MPYAVLENGKPCSHERYKKNDLVREKMRLAGWDQHVYETIEEARGCLNKWLGVQGPVKPDFGLGDKHTIYDGAVTFTIEEI